MLTSIVISGHGDNNKTDVVMFNGWSQSELHTSNLDVGMPELACSRKKQDFFLFLARQNHSGIMSNAA